MQSLISKEWTARGQAKNDGGKQEVEELLRRIQHHLEKLKTEFQQKEHQERTKVRRQKEERDYEIFPGIGYKFNSRAFTLQERHPISKERFETVSDFIREQSAATPSREQ